MSKFKSQYQRLGMEVPTTDNLAAKAQLIFLSSCQKLGMDGTAIPDLSMIPEKLRAASLAHYKLMVIREAITDRREADYDSNERKYEGWYWLDKPGFRLDVVVFFWSVTDAGAGSRLCTFSDEDQRFFSSECIALWADMMGGKLAQ